MTGLRIALAAALLLAAPAAAQETPSARERLIDHLTALAKEKTAARAALVAGIATPEAARARQVTVRATLARLIGLESAAGTVRAEVTQTSRGAGYAVDTLWYESMPGYRVTADLYRPEGAGPFPAILIQPGHGIDGKLGDHNIAVALARAGFLVLSIDIAGEGERIQFYDPEIGASKVGRPTGEHSMGFAQALPGGGHVSRFMVQDAIRGVDYLMSRADVDATRIGAFGCSGGGTGTAYLTALDPRIHAAAVACYVNDFDHLLARGGPGAQDAEQSVPFFVEQGLDLPDWIEAAAPRPFAVVSTTEDMFPIAGARAAYREARRFYEVMGASDRITMIEGPGRHGALAPIVPKIVGFFTRWLRDDPAERPYAPDPMGDPARLLVFPDAPPGPTPGSSTLAQMIAAEVPTPPPVPAGESEAARRARLQLAIREIARTRVAPGAPPPAVTLAAPQAREGYALHALSFPAAPDLRVDGLYLHSGQTGRRPTLLLLAATPLQVAAAPGGLADRWARAGWNVLILEPRGAGGTEEAKSPLTGDWTLLSLRALLVGKTPLGMRADDAIAALNWLATRPEVDAAKLVVQGSGALGPVAIHVGTLDPRVTQVVSEGAITRYREIAERPISRNAAEVNLPGVLTRYDLPDLMALLEGRLTLVNPVNSVGEPLRSAERAALPPTIRITLQSPRDALAPPVLSRR